jgi:DNA topoisomerase I
MRLLICESPGKIKTLKSILGAGWDVQASMGHVTELAADGEDSLGFDLGENAVTCRYVARGAAGGATLKKLRAAAQKAEQVYLATDPDREGEAIAWHLARELRLCNPQRITYTQITPAAVQAALKAPRNLDLALISAQRARQCLDKLVGYKVSPLLWRSTGGKSAGRVQSATLHLVCEREREIAAFVPIDYWSVWVDYQEGFRAFYKGQEIEESEELPADDATHHREAKPTEESTRVLSEAQADSLVAAARRETHRVVSVTQKAASKSPPAPLITSSLQQVAGAILGYPPEKTMRIAQDLYEGIDLPQGRKGLITYMRTDSVTLAPECVDQVREYLQANDPTNLPTKATRHRARDKAQEAHEAIRPTEIALTPKTIRASLSEEQLRLYDLIWRRTVASQCTPARLDRTTILTRSGNIQWQAKGMTVAFAGYTRYWSDLEQALVLPDLTANQSLVLSDASHEQKRTQPPPRYSEPKLVQLMERRGIGRPSTYASTIRTLKERQYLEIQGKALIPTPLGLDSDGLLSRTLPDLVDSQFTAQMELSLDEIAGGKKQWEPYLIQWNRGYLVPALSQAKLTIVDEFGHQRPARTSKTQEVSKVPCPQCKQPLVKVTTKKVKRGHFLKCTQCPEMVLFWDAFNKRWSPPKAKAETLPATTTEFACPVCGKPLEKYAYLKEGEAKTMLRCSDPKARANTKHRNVAFFWTPRGTWWSKSFGDLGAGQ